MGIAFNCSDLHISAFEGSSRLLLDSTRRNEDPEMCVDQYMDVQASRLLSVERLHAASPFDISHLCMCYLVPEVSSMVYPDTVREQPPATEEAALRETLCVQRVCSEGYPYQKPSAYIRGCANINSRSAMMRVASLYIHI